MQGLAYKIIGDKKQYYTKPDIHQLFQNKSSFSYKHAAIPLDIVRTLCSMPDLLAIDHIEQVIVLRPQVREPGFHQAGFHRAIKCGDERIAAIELPVVLGML